MIRIFFTTYILLITGVTLLQAQSRSADSSKAAKALHELVRICRSVDFGDSNTTKLGTFYKAAPHIVYRGTDKARRWKTIADYSKEEDKNGVNEVCEKINRSINQDSTWKITGYRTETESEGTWHAIIVQFMLKGKQRTFAFAFLKIGDVFALGDIDKME
jgi:hypothetical protein